jgi:hypothetical protein
MDNLSKKDQEQHVYLLMCGWNFFRSDNGLVEFYVPPYGTSSRIFGRNAAYNCQKKNESGENCECE